jgi:hypothetical protein
MLELLTGEGSIASHRLSHILNPARWDQMTHHCLAERFKDRDPLWSKVCLLPRPKLTGFLCQSIKVGLNRSTIMGPKLPPTEGGRPACTASTTGRH